MNAVTELAKNMKNIKLTMKDIFGGATFGGYLEHVFSFEYKKVAREQSIIKIMWEPENETTAHTNGHTTVINMGNPFYQSEKRGEMCLCGIGARAHETGHDLFTDFVLMKATMVSLKGGRWYPDIERDEPEIITNEIRMREWMLRNPDKREYCFQCFHSFWNSIEDGYVEDCVYTTMSGQIVDGLALMRERQLFTAPTVGNLISHDDGTAVMKKRNFDGLTLIYAKYGEIRYDRTNEDECNYEPLVMVKHIRDYIDTAVYSTDSVVRMKNVIKAFLFAWPVFEAALDENAEEAAGPSPEDPFAGIMTAVPDGDSRGSTPKGEGEDTGEHPLRRRGGGEKSDDDDGGDIPPASESWEEMTIDLEESEREMTELAKEIRKERAIEETEKALTKELEKEAKSVDYGHGIGGVHSVRVSRDISPVTKESEEAYKRIAEPYEAIARQMARKLGFLKAAEPERVVMSGFFTGSKFDASRLVYGDWRYFKQESSEIPSSGVVFEVLVDESGSMRSGGRIPAARAAALVVYLFCSMCGIKCAVYGHTGDLEGRHSLDMFNYADFDSVDGKDKYRLLQISARCENRDGPALRCAGDHLLRRPEEKKILISISDGAPCAGGYYGRSADADTAAAVKELRKKGITLFAAAIGGDKEAINAIYGGEGFINITDLNTLPEQMLDLCKRYVRK